MAILGISMPNVGIQANPIKVSASCTKAVTDGDGTGFGFHYKALVHCSSTQMDRNDLR